MIAARLAKNRQKKTAKKKKKSRKNLERIKYTAKNCVCKKTLFTLYRVVPLLDMLCTASAMSNADVTAFLGALLSHCHEVQERGKQVPKPVTLVVPPHHELVGFVAPAPSVAAQFMLDPDAPRRPVKGGRIVSAEEFGRQNGGVVDERECPICADFLRGIGDAPEAEGVRRKICTHGEGIRGQPRTENKTVRDDTPDGYWSLRTDDLPGSSPE